MTFSSTIQTGPKSYLKKIITFAYEVHGDEVYIEIVVLSKINNFVVDRFSIKKYLE